MKRSAIGTKGEDITCEYLERKGHKIIDRNFRMKFGEIDVVSRKNSVTYFIEVKTVAQDGNLHMRSYKAEERVDSRKIRKLSRVIQYYLSRKFGDETLKWEFWVIAVTLDEKTKTAKVKVIPETIGS
jgi:putative endonuclease